MSYVQLELALGKIGGRKRNQATLSLGPLCAVPPYQRARATSRAHTPAHDARARHSGLKVKGKKPLKGNNGALSRNGEAEILQQVAEIVGERAMALNGGGWRTRIREHTKAIRYAIEDFAVRTPEQKTKIANRDSWLADRFFRARAEIEAVWSKIA